MGTGEGCLVRAEVVYGGGDAHFGIGAGALLPPESEGGSGSRGLRPRGVPPTPSMGWGLCTPEFIVSESPGQDGVWSLQGQGTQEKAATILGSIFVVLDDLSPRTLGHNQELCVEAASR